MPNLAKLLLSRRVLGEFDNDLQYLPSCQAKKKCVFRVTPTLPKFLVKTSNFLFSQKNGIK